MGLMKLGVTGALPTLIQKMTRILHQSTQLIKLPLLPEFPWTPDLRINLAKPPISKTNSQFISFEITRILLKLNIN